MLKSLWTLLRKGRALLEMVPEVVTFGVKAQAYLEKHAKDPEAQSLLNDVMALTAKAESIVTVPLTGEAGDDE